MHNLLILYNPRYNSDLIKAHLDLLKECGKVAFGKVRVKNNNMPHPFKGELEKIYNDTNPDSFTQLFITDYSNLYVAKVVKISSDDHTAIAPKYYQEQNLLVESWFVITDMREIYRNEFESVRDYFLSCITLPLRDNHTYALYGNNYVYPLIIDQDQNYFEDETLHHTNIYKSKKYLKTKKILSRYCFGANIDKLMSDTIDAVVLAEIEYIQNQENILNDFSSILVKYSKSVEREFYSLFKTLFAYLCYHNPGLLTIRYDVQGIKYQLKDIFTHKPNLGSYGYLMRQSEISSTFQNLVPNDIKGIFYHKILNFMHILKDIRNENIHGKNATIKDIQEIRNAILGIGQENILITCLELKSKLNALYKESKLDRSKQI
ncbi:MAG: ATP-binding protein [Campylobacter sp.]|nr:ATP-binding protein [Campylobacter sp.]